MEEEKIKLEPFQFIRFDSETKYFGTTRGKKFNGIGYLKRRHGQIYIGEFIKGKLDGLGIYKNSDEEIIGEYKENILEGIGKITQKKNTYIGEFLENQLCGVGEIITKSGIRHRGVFNQGLLNGYGEIYNPKSNSSVTGYFEKGTITGEGREIYGDLTFFGNFEKGVKKGKGIIVQNNRCVFKGNWINGKKSGFCHYELSPYHFYDGMVEVDKRQGTGKLVDKANSMTYTGEYIDDLRHGFGRMESKDFLYVGDWYRGKKDGLGYQKNFPRDNGEKRAEDGYSYFGFWKNGHKHGIGYETTATREIKGEFWKGVHHGKAVIKPKGRNKSVYAFFQDGELLRKISKHECRDLLKSNLDINTFFKESKSRLAVMETFLCDQKKKVYYNHRFVKEKIEKDQNLLQHSLDRIYLHYIRIRSGLKDLKEKIVKVAEGQINFKLNNDFDFFPERFDEEIQLDHIYFNSEGEMRRMLENSKYEDDYTFVIKNGCVHSKFPHDVYYGEYNDFSDLWRLRHPWLLQDKEKYSMIIEKKFKIFVRFFLIFYRSFRRRN